MDHCAKMIGRHFKGTNKVKSEGNDKRLGFKMVVRKRLDVHKHIILIFVEVESLFNINLCSKRCNQNRTERKITIINKS